MARRHLPRSFDRCTLAEKLEVAAHNVESARSVGIAEYLAGWEHQIIREALAVLSTTPSQGPDAKEGGDKESDDDVGYRNGSRGSVSSGSACASDAPVSEQHRGVSCWACNGDCGSANPPVSFCPMRDAKPATPSQRLDAATVEREALAWLADQPRCAVEHFGPVYGDDDDQSEGWRVMRENGSINDREWDEIGRGDTPLAAIQVAALATDPHQHGGKA